MIYYIYIVNVHCVHDTTDDKKKIVVIKIKMGFALDRGMTHPANGNIA